MDGLDLARLELRDLLGSKADFFPAVAETAVLARSPRVDLALLAQGQTKVFGDAQLDDTLLGKG